LNKKKYIYIYYNVFLGSEVAAEIAVVRLSKGFWVMACSQTYINKERTQKLIGDSEPRHGFRNEGLWDIYCSAGGHKTILETIICPRC